MNVVKSVAILASTAILLSACSSTPTVGASKMALPDNNVPAPVPMPARAAMPSPVKTVVVPAYLDPRNPIATERSVYFDFDAYIVKSDYTGLVERQGKFLAAHPAVSVKVEGNTDERGGAEYNLALGQKRAEAVRQALKAFGVNDAQMEAVSWGKQKPKAEGRDEAAWAQNRRADIVYPDR